MELIYKNIGIVGAGPIAQGIAQIAAQAGSKVSLADLTAGAAGQARRKLYEQWHSLVQKGELQASTAEAYKERVRTGDLLAELTDCDLVVEALPENLDLKQGVLRELEQSILTDATLATTASLLSVTTLGAKLKHPDRLVGLQFFQPAQRTVLLEVIAGAKTSSAVRTAMSHYAVQMGAAPVQAQDTPGFIVNHVAQAYASEALRIVSEQIADFATVDRILRDQAGFTLGPFEQMDATGLDVVCPMMESIYHRHHEEARYRPNPIAAQRLAGGMLGQKSGQGFYQYQDGLAQMAVEAATPQVLDMPPVWVSPRASRRAELLQLLKSLGAKIETGASASPQALVLVAPLGFDVTTVAVVERLDPARTVGIDMLVDDATTRRRVLATNPATRVDMRNAAHALFARDGKAVSVIRDSGGFVTQRVIASLVNIASDICQQAICSPKDLETASLLGLGYPLGPLAMGDRYGPTNILEILFNMQTVYGDQRYRPSPWLRRRGAIGLSLMQEES